MSPPKLHGFHTFADQNLAVELNGAFRDNIRSFVKKCAQLESYKVGEMHIWCSLLVYEKRGMVVPLYTVEENVENSGSPFCDYCRCAGWSHHFVSKRKYHFIIPGTNDWNKPLDENVFDLQTHLLHGLIHCNGHGHLICINGIEGGSKFIAGAEIMDLWDRICSSLQARKIAIEDTSKKYMMDLRLLYGVAYGQSWFGRWGYRFCHGSFGVKQQHYERAIDDLSSLELDQVIDDFSPTNGCAPIKQIIHYYRGISDTNLVTIRDLFKFMLSQKLTPSTQRCSTTFLPSWPRKNLSINSPMKKCLFKRTSRVPAKNCSFGKDKQPAKCRKFSSLAASMDSRWPVRRLEYVAEVIVEALKEKQMTRQEARDAARLQIGDTGLIDHVLKAMNNVIVGKYIVRRAVNRCTKVLEYSIQDLHGKAHEVCLSKAPVLIQSVNTGLGRDVLGDVFYMYKNVLMGLSSNESAVDVILHSKHFVKEWPFRDENDELLRFVCNLTMSSSDFNAAEVYNDFPLGEYIVVPPFATVGDLKIAVQNAMRDTYCVLDKLVITEIVDMEGEDDNEVLFGIIESGEEIRARGLGLDFETSELRFEGGNESWIVRCKCGALDDDGERMVACDICETWQHTRCNGIKDSEVVPRLFVCDVCCSSLVPEPVQLVPNASCGEFEYDQYETYEAPMEILSDRSGVNMGLMYCC